MIKTSAITAHLPYVFFFTPQTVLWLKKVLCSALIFLLKSMSINNLKIVMGSQNRSTQASENYERN
jgi:hypothetical protein